jgi:hypothetical protein
MTNPKLTKALKAKLYSDVRAHCERLLRMQAGEEPNTYISPSYSMEVFNAKVASALQCLSLMEAPKARPMRVSRHLCKPGHSKRPRI